MKVIIALIVLTGIIVSLPGNESRSLGFVPHGSTSGKFGVEERSIPLETENTLIQSTNSKVESKSTQSVNSVPCRRKRDIHIQRAQDESTAEGNKQRNRRLNELNKNTDADGKRTKRSLLNPGSVKPTDPTKIDSTTTASPASYFAVAWIHSFMMK